jgi:hypothetical protein
MKVTIIPGTPGTPEQRIELDRRTLTFEKNGRYPFPYERSEIRERVIPAVEAVEEKVVIECDRATAQTLADICQFVGGCQDTTRRGLIQKLYEEFQGSGFDTTGKGVYGDVGDIEGSLYFTSRPR